MQQSWPELPYAAWQDTYATLHMWMQIVGKVALARAAPLNHSWGIAFHLTPRGLRTGLLTYEGRAFTMTFDFLEHQLVIETSDGVRRTLPLAPRSVAAFYREVMTTLDEMALPVRIWPMPVEIPSPIRFEQDTVHHSYDPKYVERWWNVLARVHDVLDELPVLVHWQVQSRPFLLGQFRSGRHPLFGTAGAAAGRPGVHARRVLARSDQPRLLAGECIAARAGALCVCGPRAARPQDGGRPAGRRLLSS